MNPTEDEITQLKAAVTSKPATPATQQIPEDPPESRIGFLRWTVSVRSLITVLLVGTLCYLTINNPEQYAQRFIELAGAAVFFWLGQGTGRKTS